MGRAIIFPDHFFTQPFSELLRKEAHPRNRLRLLAMVHLQEGHTLTAVATMVKVHWKTVQSWLQRFRTNGFEGLYESARCGAPRKINKESEQWLAAKIEQLSTDSTGGFITGKMLHQQLQDEKECACSLRTIYNALHYLGLSWISCRSQHPKSNPEQQEAYKKTLPTN